MSAMRTSGWVPATATAVAMLSVVAGPSLAEASSGHCIVRAELLGSMPAPASPTIAGVKPGGAPWANGQSEVRVRADGRITVTLRGLVIPPPVGNGSNPVAAVVATLVCDGSMSSTAPFALSTRGDGSTTGMVRASRDCDDPVVLIQPAANRAVYIAATQDDGERDD